MGKKRCTKCERVKAIENFGWKSKAHLKRKSWCSRCERTYLHEYYLKNPEKFRIYRRNWQQSAKGRTWSKRYYALNEVKIAGRERQKKRKEKLLAWWFEYKKSLRCSRCSENHPACLVFHHDNPKKKERAISQMIVRIYPREKILEEIKKCTVLCANCHRKLHWKLKEKIKGSIKE